MSEKRVARLMKELGLEVVQPKYKAEHNKSLPRVHYKNILYRHFNQPKPNLYWVSDVTYIRVGDQYHYICVILDLFSRSVLSYRVSAAIDAVLCMISFDEAYNTRKPEGLTSHSDQGAQYTAFMFRQHLRSLKVRQSFSTPGNPYDNSVCESFFHMLKNEALYHHLYETPEQLEWALNEYIEFYNGYRPHRKLNMKSSIQFEEVNFFTLCDE